MNVTKRTFLLGALALMVRPPALPREQEYVSEDHVISYTIEKMVFNSCYGSFRGVVQRKFP